MKRMMGQADGLQVDQVGSEVTRVYVCVLAHVCSAGCITADTLLLVNPA